MQTPFSEHLAAIIAADGRTVARLAREAVPPLRGSTLNSWRIGARVPSDGNQLATLVELLRLNKGEAEVLRRKYQAVVTAKAILRLGWRRSDLRSAGIGRALIHGARPHHVCLSRFDGRWIATGPQGTTAGELSAVLGVLPPPAAPDLAWVQG